MNNILSGIFEWIKNDWKSSKFRFFIEVLAWAISIGCATTMALTVPNPPLIILYPIWIAGCAMYAWCAFTRKSFGMLANYLLLVTIDTVGLVRLFLN
jgi:cellulose synthase/poly-beta-1,6-N-acetylglucosamine synthase-like glycosyltransferase